MAEEQVKDQPIIVVKKKVSHGGHHGGAWKVAYADFVTAMMALFIVLWLLNTSEEVQKAIASYFNDPHGSGEHSGSGVAGGGSGIEVHEDNMDQLKEMLDQALKQAPEFDQLKDNVEMSVTGEGLRIELLESEGGMFFQSGSSTPSQMGAALISQLAEELGQMPNRILIEGHTDARPFGSKDSYTNWELSVDRANAARRLMESRGLQAGQVVQVRGFADQDLRDREHPEAAANRRISVIVRYLHPPPGSDETNQAVTADEGSGEDHGEPLALNLDGKAEVSREYDGEGALVREETPTGGEVPAREDPSDGEASQEPAPTEH